MTHREVQMSQVPIVSLGDSAAVVLPPDVLKSIGLQVGDVVELAVADRQLILRPVPDPARRELFESITREVFERRRDAYQRLA